MMRYLLEYEQYVNGNDLGQIYMFVRSDRFSFSHIDSLVRSVAENLFTILAPPGVDPKVLDPEKPIYNYGNYKELKDMLDSGKLKRENVYNEPENLVYANSKVEFHKKMAGFDFVPKTVFDSSKLSELKFPIIAKPDGGSKGEGIEVFKTKEDLDGSGKTFGVYSEKFDLKREFRVISVNGKIVFVAERIPENEKAKSLRESEIHEYYYNSIGKMSNMKEVKELDVVDRGNYTAFEFNRWLKKYKIGLNQKVVWVTKKEVDVLPYIVNRGDGFYRIPAGAGYLIEESDDGDGGFIMVVTDPDVEFEWVSEDSIKEGKDLFDDGGTLDKRSSYEWKEVDAAELGKDDLINICKKSHEALGLEVLGVDVGLDSSGKLFLIECNTCPGLNKSQIVLIYEALFEDFYGRKPDEHSQKKIDGYRNELVRANQDPAKFSYSPHMGRRFFKIGKHTVDGEEHGPTMSTVKYDMEKSFGDSLSNIKKKRLENFESYVRFDLHDDPYSLLEDQENGVLYHGTQSPNFKEFKFNDTPISNQTYGRVDDHGLGVFFTDNMTMAEWFAGMKEYDSDKDAYVKIKGSKGRVIKAKVNLKNPHVIQEKNAGTTEYDSVQEYFWEIRKAGGAAKYRKKLMDKGYDGIILKDCNTNFYMDGTYDVYVVFDPKNIKIV